MSWFGIFRSGRGPKAGTALQLLAEESASGYAPGTQDTVAAINELSQVVKNNPDAVEIYLALGNLYRARGEIERAVQIRNSLIVRPGLDKEFKARAWYELGRDYKRGGFVDRALRAFEEARSLWGDHPGIVRELARLSAESGDYETAARHYARLEHRQAEAHYLSRLAEQAYGRDDDSAGRKWLHKALKVLPGSPEARRLRLHRDFAGKDWKKLERHLREAMDAVEDELRFVLLEGLLNPGGETSMGLAEVSGAVTASSPSPQDREAYHKLCEVALPLIDEQDPELLLVYYGAWLLLRCDETERAREWLEKALVLRSDFWPARLELLGLSMAEQDISPVFKVQLEFFIKQTHLVKRFVCRVCGLKREQVFFVCPRCQSWHSISFRTALHD